MAKRLLLNFPYYNPVGHLLEALKYAKGFHAANRDLEVHLAVGQDTAYELAQGCSWIHHTYAIAWQEFVHGPDLDAPCLQVIPREWDYVVENNLLWLQTEGGTANVGWYEAPIVAYLQTARTAFGGLQSLGQLFFQRGLPEGLGYAENQAFRIEIPTRAQQIVATWLNDQAPVLTVVLSGSSGRAHYPSVEAWIHMLTAIHQAFPALLICLTGKTWRADGRTASPLGPEEVSRICQGVEGCRMFYDVDIWQQLALLQASTALLSPHTGFGFLAPAVGTPWVTLSGGNWPEYFFNHVPFYSVLPDNPDYPYQGRLDSDLESGRIPGMEDSELAAKVPEVIEAIELVGDPAFTFEAAMARHRTNIARANVRRAVIPTASPF